MSDWEEHAVEEESSYISMTDMMVGLLLIFIILLTYFVMQSRSEAEAASRVSKVEQAAVVARGLIFDRIESRIDDDRVDFDANSGTIRFSDEILRFASNSSEIPIESYDVLSNLAAQLAATVPCLAHLDSDQPDRLDCSWLDENFAERGWAIFGRDLGSFEDFRQDDSTGAPNIWIDGVIVEGHTDCVPFGGVDPDFGNWRLGAERAARTYLFLTEQSPTLEQIFSKDPDDPVQAGSAHRVMGVASFADRRPASSFSANEYPNDPRRAGSEWLSACGAQMSGSDGQMDRNRRIDIRIILGWTTQVAAANGA